MRGLTGGAVLGGVLRCRAWRKERRAGALEGIAVI